MSIKYLTQPELKRFFAGIDIPRDRALFGMIYHYGLRVTEATLVKPSDLDFNRKTIQIYRLKGGNGGVKPLPPSITRLLEEYLMAREPTGDALFTGKRGSLGRHRIGQLFKRYTTKAGLSGFSVHCLRHSIATHMLEAGCGEDEVFDQVGSIKIGVGTASEMRIGETDIIYADVFDDEGVEFSVLRGFDPRDVKWKSANSSTAEVSYLKETADVIAFNPNSSFAKVVGKKAGTATITAQYKGVSDSVEIKVR